jgi:hypothetical protein
MPLTAAVPSFPIMTRSHKDTSVTRRRALAVTGGTVAAGGLAVAGYQSAFADETTTTAAADAEATASATSTSSGQCVLMSSVTEGPYYLDGALVRKDITEGKGGVPLTLRITVQDTTESCGPVAGAAGDLALRRLGLLLRLHHRQPRRLRARRE